MKNLVIFVLVLIVVIVFTQLHLTFHSVRLVEQEFPNRLEKLLFGVDESQNVEWYQARGKEFLELYHKQDRIFRKLLRKEEEDNLFWIALAISATGEPSLREWCIDTLGLSLVTDVIALHKAGEHLPEITMEIELVRIERDLNILFAGSERGMLLSRILLVLEHCPEAFVDNLYELSAFKKDKFRWQVMELLAVAQFASFQVPDEIPNTVEPGEILWALLVYSHPGATSWCKQGRQILIKFIQASPENPLLSQKVLDWAFKIATETE